MSDQPENPAGNNSGVKAPAAAPHLVRTIRTASGKDISFAPGDYLFNLAAKVVVYVATPGKPPLYAELRARSLVLSNLHKALSPDFPGHAPLADPYQRDWVNDLLQELHACPRLQQPLAYIVDYVPSKWLLEQEATVICKARAIHGRKYPTRPPAVATGTAVSRNDPSTWLMPDTVYNWAWEAGLRGLCLSGGGIRSATFNLGVLQQLAAQKKINRFDYLSSVSGGGYIHGWLAAWLRRESGRQHEELRQSNPAATLSDKAAATRAALDQVQKEMSPIPDEATSAALPHIYPAREIRWLRQFSNYLTPQKGLFTLDTWTAFAIWLRNTFLNQLFLISALLCILLIPTLLAKVWLPDASQSTPLSSARSNQDTLTLKGTLASSTGSVTSSTTFSMTAVKTTAPAGNPGLDTFKKDYLAALSGEAYHQPPTPSSALPVQQYGEKPDMPERIAGFSKKHILGILRIFETFSFVTFLGGAFLLYRLLQAEVKQTRGQEDDTDAAQLTPDPCQRPYVSKSASEKDQAPQCKQRDANSVHKVRFILGSLLFPSVPFCYALCWPGPGILEVAFVTVALFTLSLGVAFGGDAFRLMGTRTTVAIILKRLAASIGATIFGVGVFVFIAALIRTATVEHWGVSVIDHAVPALELSLGAPLLASIPFFTISVLIGFIGRSFFDWLRELLGRLLASTLLVTVYWLAFFSIALLSPGLFLYAVHATAIKISSALIWVATTAASVISGKSPQTTGTASKSGVSSIFNAELLATIGPYVYIVGLLAVLSLLIRLAVGETHPAHHAWLALVAVAALAILLYYRLDATAFSLFPFYRNRLTRCYLGASNRSRDPNPLTGFDDRDTRGLQLSCLRPDRDYPGPFPIFSATLNMTTGSDLAYQERKAAAFAFTPLYSGYAVSWTEGKPDTSFNGYVPTESYAVPQGGLNMASAIAISGAAVSPNMGYHTKPATAFLLTMFNARLGRWLPNTRRQQGYSGHANSQSREKEDVPDTPNGRVLINELIGETDDSSDFIYLSDGGHFDNMGLYELVRRRCYDIVVCDAEEDGGYIFDGIGQTIRKCRIDFGVEIQLDFSKLRCAAKTRFSSAHVARGTIRYPEAPGRLGTVTYIKASLVSFPLADGSAVSPSDLPNLPGDIQSYYLQHTSFPHDSTLQQWFTESQFESYRRLGHSVIQSIAPLASPDVLQRW